MSIQEKQTPPSADQWLREAKQDPSAARVGMYLLHNGTVRGTARVQARQGQPAPPVQGMLFSFDPEAVARAVDETYQLPGVYYIRTWLNSGRLSLGDDIMLVLVGGDVRPHVVDALQFLVEKIKSRCVSEQELTAAPDQA